MSVSIQYIPGQVVKVWGVIVNTDTTEGRGADYVHCLAITKEIALEVAKGKGAMGSDADVKQVPVIFDTRGNAWTLKDKNPSKIITKSREDEEKLLNAAKAELTQDELDLILKHCSKK